MKLSLKHFLNSNKLTLGLLATDSKFNCFTLEDPYHPIKIPGCTRIPTGTYKVKLRTDGGLHQRYLQRFPDIHKGMLWLQDVPDFEYVYMHIGNDPDDTAGCILLGGSVDAVDGSLLKSEIAYRAFYPSVAAAILRGEEVEIEITDEDYR